jgi:hypothetical protein
MRSVLALLCLSLGPDRPHLSARRAPAGDSRHRTMGRICNAQDAGAARQAVAILSAMPDISLG